MAQPASSPTPALIFETLTAHQRTAALKTAINLDVFTAIAGGANTPAALAGLTNASERGLRILCDYLTTIGFLTKNGTYGLSEPSAAFLDKKSQTYLGSAADFLASDTILDAHRVLTAAVRKGGTALSDEGTMSPDDPVWVNFARNMMPMMFPAAQQIAGLLQAAGKPVRRVLDIAAGHGLFGCMVGKAFPEAQVTAVDWAAVVEVAAENAQRFGLAGRFHKLPGSAFDVEFGTGYDVALVTNFYHHFSASRCTALAKKIHSALAPGGRMLTLDFVPDEDRLNPPMAAQFPLMMVATTAEGDAYTFREYDQMFQQAGFSSIEMHDLSGMPQRVVISGK